jgi:pimeloyl-ACP methyl ester carboxylesterase|tara:strand:+ start:18 stop:323 length:306 start_codon:yes stop_codon:yes gene_type:complete
MTFTESHSRTAGKDIKSKYKKYNTMGKNGVNTLTPYGSEMSRDVIRLMDHLNIPTAHLLGYSLGIAPIGMAITENELRFISAVFGGGAAIWEWGSTKDLLN